MASVLAGTVLLVCAGGAAAAPGALDTSFGQNGVATVDLHHNAALSGLAGGLIAPLSGVVPTMGVAYVAKAFITVITGGASVITGTAISAALLGAISTETTFLTTPVIGDVALLLAAIVLLRLLPSGLTGRLFKGAP